MTRAEQRRQTACFTGHRQLGFPREEIEARTRAAILELIERGYRYFGAGGARGFDALASELVLELRRSYPHIHLIMVLPFPDQYKQERTWSRAEIEQYYSLQARASKVVTLSQEYSSGVYYRRNRHLVAGSSVCVAYMERSNTGTSMTVNYARSRGLEVVNVAP